MALKITNPKSIITPDNRVIPNSTIIWIKPYFPTATNAQAECVVYSEAKDYIDQQLALTPSGTTVFNITFSLDEMDFFTTLHTKVIEKFLEVDSTLQIEYYPFEGLTTPPVEEEQSPAPEEEEA